MTRSTTILIVDDEPFNIEICKAYLEGRYDIIGLASGEECIRYLESSPPPDLILMDWMMPEPDGLMCTQHIRQTPKLSNIPVIMVSAKGNQTEITHAFKFGINAFVIKPFEEDELIKVIDSYLNKD